MNKFKEMIRKKTSNEDGYVSIEAIIVAGVAIALGVGAFSAFKTKADSITETALGKIDDVQADIEN
ncbi:MAG: hypothetical protein R3Y64_11340 [Peptostreptococcaceae bacterium]